MSTSPSTPALSFFRRIAAKLGLLRLAAGLLALGLSPAVATDGAWTFALDEREQPGLTYSEGGDDIFFIGCGRAFAVHAVYPGNAKRTGKAAITIAAERRRMVLRGEIDEPGAGDPGRARFTQWDLGYRRQNPALFGKAWRARENRLLDLLDSGRPLTISAGKKSYALPPVDAPNWKTRFKQHC